MEIPPANEQPEEIIFRQEDAPARKKADEALKEIDVLFEQLLEHSPIYVFFKDEQIRALRLSRNYEQMLGMPLDRILGKTMDDLFPSDLAKSMIADDKRVLQGGKVVRVEEELNGRLYETTKFPILVEGKPKYLAGYTIDVTEAKMGKVALLKAKEEADANCRANAELLEKLNEAQQIAGIGSWDWDMETDRVWWSDETYRIFGVTPQSYVPSVDANARFFHPEDSDVFQKKFAQAIETGNPLDVELRIVLGDGTIKWCYAQGKVYYGKTGRPVRYIGTILDITEHKRSAEEREKLQEQLNQAQKMESVGRLAGGVAHDFNNMLGIMLGYSDMLLEDLPAEDPSYEKLSEIRKAASRSADLTRQLLAFARKQTVSPKVLDLNDTVSGMLKMLQRLLGEDMELSWVPGYDLGSVKMDPSQIDQILANLCINARDAVAENGKILIETMNVVLDDLYCRDHPDVLPGAYVMLAVSDNGSGMNASVMNQIFEPFFTTKSRGQGTGLGLATVYGIVKQNNGSIHVYSEPGHGTTFRIYLPRYTGNPADAFVEQDLDSVRGSGEMVLLVEDEQELLRLGADVLSQLGYVVIAAGDPAEALRLAGAHEGNIDLLVTDVVMPGMNGRDLATRLIMRYPDLKCLFMSGYTADVIAHQGVLDEGVHFIQKPFTRKDLAVRVRQVLDARK